MLTGVQGKTRLGVFPQKIAQTATPAKDSSATASLIWLAHTLSLSLFRYAFETIQLLVFHPQMAEVQDHRPTCLKFINNYAHFK